MQLQPNDPNLQLSQTTQEAESQPPPVPQVSPSSIYPSTATTEATPGVQTSQAPDQEQVLQIIIQRRRSATLCVWIGAVLCIVFEILLTGSNGKSPFVALIICLLLSAYGGLLYFINNSNLKQLHPSYRIWNKLCYLWPAYLMIVELALAPFRILSPKSYIDTQSDIYFGYRSYTRWLPRAKYIEGYYKSLFDGIATTEVEQENI